MCGVEGVDPVKWKALNFCLRVSLASACLVTGPVSIAEDVRPTFIGMVTTEERQMVVAEMQGDLDDLLLGRKFFDGDDLPVTAKVSIDEPNKVIVVDLDERLGPRAYTAESEDMNQLIFNSLINFVEKIDGMTGITYRYGGHEPEYWSANSLPVVSPR